MDTRRQTRRPGLSRRSHHRRLGHRPPQDRWRRRCCPISARRAIDRIWLDTTRDVHTATASVLGMILVRDRLDMAQSIAAGGPGSGCIWPRRRAGIAAQPLNQPVEMIDRHHMLGKARRIRSGARQAGARKTAGNPPLSSGSDTRSTKRRARRGGPWSRSRWAGRQPCGNDPRGLEPFDAEHLPAPARRSPFVISRG